MYFALSLFLGIIVNVIEIYILIFILNKSFFENFVIMN
jgi:hypothetical protein